MCFGGFNAVLFSENLEDLQGEGVHIKFKKMGINVQNVSINAWLGPWHELSYALYYEYVICVYCIKEKQTEVIPEK